MSEPNPTLDPEDLNEWQLKIQTADRNNILSHCQNCHYEWIDSDWNIPCPHCNSVQIEQISCWQFPDD